MRHAPALLLFKAASIPAGARWITVRPNGPGTEGHPVLIQPSGDGAFHVIGGAGGKLNYLKLTGVRSEAEYAARQKESAAARKQQRLDQAKRDREAGIAGQKQKALDQLRLTAQQARNDFVKTVSAALGWTPDQTAFKPEDHQDKSPAEVNALAQAHFDQLYKTAEAAVQAQRARILSDAEFRAEGGLATIPITAPADPERISVADLDPVEPDGARGLGFQPQYEKRAAEAGATPEDMRAEAAEAQPKREVPEDQQQARQDAQQARKDVAAKTAEQLDMIREKTPRPDPKARADAKAAMAVLRAERDLRAKLKQVRGRAKEIAKADSADDIAAPAYVIETAGAELDEQVRKGLEDDLRTIRTRGFLAEAQAQGAAAVTKHVSAGAFASVNSLALAAGGSALLDRSVVDVLGIAGAAQALAHRLAADLPPEEVAQIREAMGRYHVAHYMERSRAALDEARELQEQAAEIELGEAANGADLALAQELNARRRDLARQAKATLATALGEMEANAAIVTALEKPTRERITVPLGELAATDAIVRLRAIGLDRGDYTIERAGRNTIAVIKGEAVGKLTQPIAREDIERVNRSLAIMSGLEDENDWLPDGVARRPDFGKAAPAGVAPRLARPFPAQPGDVRQAVRDYIGGRAADGDSPADIMAGLLAEDVIQRAGDREAFMAAVNEVAPLYDADGKMIRAETHADAFQTLADEFAARAYGSARAPIHRQPLTVDKVSAEALHRAFAKLPEATLGFKPVGDLTTEEQGAIRQFFAREFASADPEAKAKRDRVAELDGQEPEKETDGLFGRAENPDWSRWKRERDEAAEAANTAEFSWPRYVQAHGGPAPAYQAMQDILRGRAIEAFAREHNTLRPDAPLRLGRAAIRGDLAHLDAVDPKARERREQERRDLTDQLRNRIAGRYAQGSVADKLAAAREAEEAADQAQMGLFGDPAPAAAAKDATLPENTAPLGPGERWTVGHAAERQLAGMTATQGAMWRPGQPVNLFAPTMSGRFAPRQRAVKLIANNRRVMLGMGVGSGKTSIALSSFTHLKAKGEAKRGLFLVPSVVQGQFGAEANAMLEPGKFRWHANPGADRTERIGAMKDESHDFVVQTHQAFRDDVLHMAAEHAGTTPEAVAERLAGMTPEARGEFMRDTLAREGINFDFLTVDEGHNLLNRKGKENSRMADVIDGVAHGMGTYVNMTADPVKNDASEVFDTLAKMDPARYRDRDAFLRRYGVDTEAAKEGLRREIARHYYTASVAPGVEARRQSISVPLHPEDQARVAAIQKAAGAARLARLEGRVDIAAMRELTPRSFQDAPAEQHEEVARRLQDAIGVVRDAAMRRALSGRGKVDALAKIAGERKGRPGVVFCRHLDQVEALAERLRAEGHRVTTMTGAHGAKEKDRIKREFQSGQHDILIASDAGAVGANLQHGKWLAQFDVPMTAMLHAQRNGRIHRIGQTEDVELFDLHADHPEERMARDRLARKYGLRDIVTSPLDGLDDTGLAGMLARIRSGKAATAPAERPATAAERAETQAAEAKAAPKVAQPELV